jgi:hypothetical protein
LTYLREVKNRFQDKKEVYDTFLEIMKEFKAQRWVAGWVAGIAPGSRCRCLAPAAGRQRAHAGRHGQTSHTAGHEQYQEMYGSSAGRPQRAWVTCLATTSIQMAMLLSCSEFINTD